MKKYIQKIRQRGYKWVLKAFFYKITQAINMCLFDICKMLPIQNDLIVFESEGDFCDNSYALYEYMLKNGYMRKYKVVWFVQNINEYKDIVLENTHFCYKDDNKINFLKSYYLAICRFYIYDHCNFFEKLVKRKNQTIVNLWHGTPLKAPSVGNKKIRTSFDIGCSTSKMASKNSSIFLHCDVNKFVNLGYPRNDYFFSDFTIVREKIRRIIQIDQYKKIILWMPTYRQSVNPNISEEYITNETGLSILNTYDELQALDYLLLELNVLLILKVHHLQAALPVFKSKYTNIRVIEDKEIQLLGIQLYQFITISDFLITDYSSVALDYLLLNRPIIYTIDDFEQYKAFRGFINDNVLDYMPGEHIENSNALKEAIIKHVNGQDTYINKRKRVMDIIHSHIDGNSCKRIISFLQL